MRHLLFVNQRLRRLSLAVGLIVMSQLGAAAVSAQILTFSVRYEHKLFINTIPLLSCGNPGILLKAANFAAYIAFCQATSLGENPPTGAIIAPPLDARIRGEVTVRWRCQAGNAAPIGPTSVTVGPTAAGHEGPIILGILGTVTNPPTRDNIAANRTWGWVLSGSPNIFVEVSFQVHKPRIRTAIWDRLQGTIQCGVDANGNPTSTVTDLLTYTRFPSHRVWYHTPAPGAGVGVVHFNLAQGSFDELWVLPPVGVP